MRTKLIYSILFLLLVLGLAEGQAWGQYRAAYWDGNYGTAWAGGGEGTRDALETAGYEILDAAGLKTWMDARIADGAMSVVVFCRDAVPDTVAETMSATCTLRRYLNAGGKIVWQSDIPFYYMTTAGGANTTWGDGGATAILGFNTSGVTRDIGGSNITAEGIEWGITESWGSQRAADPALVDIVLATDNNGNAAAWVKHYAPGDIYGGFVRLRDTSGQANIDDILRVAEYGLGGNPFARNPNPADGAMKTETWASMGWSAGDFAASHDVYFGDNFDDVNDGTGDTFQGNQGSVYFVAGFAGYAFPEGLVYGGRYYWRIDEVNEDDPNSPWKGKVWSFWIQPKKAYDPVPGDGGKFVDYENPTLSWTAGLGAVLHTVYFSDNFDDVNDGVGGTQTPLVNFTPGPVEAEKTYYWRVDELTTLGTNEGDVWSFTTMPDIAVTDPNLVGWWKLEEGPGNIAIDWSGYGNHATLQGNPQWVDGYDGGALQCDGSGDWATTGLMPADYGLDGGNPKTVTAWVYTTGSSGGIFDMGSQSNGQEYCLRPAGTNQWRIQFWGSPPDWDLDFTYPSFNQWVHFALTYDGTTCSVYANGAYIDSFSPALNTANAAFVIGRYGPSGGFAGIIDDVRLYNKALTQQEIEQAMRGDTTRAWNASPADGVISDVFRAASLSWSPGDSVSQHAVYFGTDKDAVAGADTSDTTGVFRGLQAGASYTPPEGVEWGGGSYFWRIDEHNTDETVTRGNVWTFFVADYIIVDDVEDYRDDNPIWENWLDGIGYGVLGTPGYYPGNGTGSAVGDETTASYTEETIVHSGGKAMPVWYNNVATAISEIELTLPGQDWTANNLLTLSLWFFGDAANVPGQLYVKVNGVQKLYDGDNSNLTKGVWQPWNIDLASFSGLQNVTKIAIGIQGNGATGKLIFDDIRLYALARETITPVQPDPAGLVAQYAFDGNANDSVGSNHGTLQGNPQWVTGYYGNALAFDGTGDWLDCGNDPSLGISGAV
ncbi:MAG TPA: LamG domain-containing protein, partial [Sedimentisphaerales bacterium]|nr:LamG domain-containing protein [Sedimentisphaerales bacterium]